MASIPTSVSRKQANQESEEDLTAEEDGIPADAGPIGMPSIQRQLIYGDYGSQRTVPMRVIVVGMPGTCTSAIEEALKRLGITKIYNTEHFFAPRSTTHHPRMIKMLSGEVRKHRNIYFTSADFNPILSNYEAVIDWPGAVYATDLMIAYRNAKVILTTLPDSAKQPWLKRMQSAFAALHSSPLIKLLLRTDLGNYRSTHDLLMTISKAFFDGNIAQHAMMSYKIHEGRIRGTLTLQRKSEDTDLLHFDPHTSGWEPLCKFLDLPIPSSRFPVPSGYEDSIDAYGYSDPTFKHLEPWRLFLRYADYRYHLSTILLVPFVVLLAPVPRLPYWAAAAWTKVAALFAHEIFFVKSEGLKDLTGRETLGWTGELGALMALWVATCPEEAVLGSIANSALWIVVGVALGWVIERTATTCNPHSPLRGTKQRPQRREVASR